MSIKGTYTAVNARNCTPSDKGQFEPTRYVAAGQTGTLRVMTAAGEVLTLPATVVTNGWGMALSIIQVFATGTTASDIVLFW